MPECEVLILNNLPAVLDVDESGAVLDCYVETRDHGRVWLNLTNEELLQLERDNAEKIAACMDIYRKERMAYDMGCAARDRGEG